MNLQLRRALPEESDLLSAIAFAAKAYWGYPEHWMEIWKPQLTFDAQRFAENESWTATVEDQPIGFYILQDKDGNAWIDDLWVMPEYIGKGVGKTLFLHATELARQRGYKILQLEADPNAAGFYLKMGMHKIGERRSQVDGTPRVLPIMEMNL